ncbi:MAG: hypothetical protein ACYCQK_01935 [Acidiferrobacteraceae bacterium]
MTEPRRWRIHGTGTTVSQGGTCVVTQTGAPYILAGPSLDPFESVSVTPVAEYEELREAAQELAKASATWLAETAPGMHINTAVGRGRTRRALARLRALLAPPASEER